MVETHACSQVSSACQLSRQNCQQLAYVTKGIPHFAVSLGNINPVMLSMQILQLYCWTTELVQNWQINSGLEGVGETGT